MRGWLLLGGVVAANQGEVDGKEYSQIVIFEDKNHSVECYGLGGSKRRACVKDLCKKWKAGLIKWLCLGVRMPLTSGAEMDFFH